jgi:hypothetical protein
MGSAKGQCEMRQTSRPAAADHSPRVAATAASIPKSWAAMRHCHSNTLAWYGRAVQHSLMDKLSYRRHRFPSIVIQQAIWLYFGFALSYRNVEDMLAERGIDVSYETARRWALKFGTIISRKLRRGGRGRTVASR